MGVCMARFDRVGFSCVAALLLSSLAAGGTATAMQASTPVPWQLQSASGELTFGVGVSVGTVAGTAYERVYVPEVYPGYKGSELVWDLEGIVLVGAQGTVAYGRRFRANLGLWSAVNEGTGGMVDYDWFYVGEDWSNRSEHPDTSLDEGIVLDVNLGVMAFQAGPFSLHGVLGYKSETWKWSARGGSYIYSDLENDGFRDQRGSFPDGELGIVYEQKYSVPYAGFGMAAEWSRFRVESHVLYSPWVMAEDTDDHVIRETLFTGEFSGGTYVGIGASATWHLTSRLSLTGSLESEKISEIIGDVTIDAPEGTFSERDGGSVEISTLMLSLAAAFRF